MIIQSKYKTTYIYGIISKDKIRFDDSDLFRADLWKYAVLKKIKIWWGTPAKNENIPKSKTILGIQCTYKNIMTGEEIDSDAHCGQLESSDLITKEIKLKQGDYFNKFYIGFDTNISFIKFTTKNDEVIEFGEPIPEDLKKVQLNEGGLNMVQCFIGYYNKNRITALGCKYISKKDYIFLNIMDILRLRHFFKINDKERDKWNNEKRLNNCNLFIKAIAKLCLLPDAQFYSIIKYCA